jgi:hypothetical protein
VEGAVVSFMTEGLHTEHPVRVSERRGVSLAHRARAEPSKK